MERKSLYQLPQPKISKSGKASENLSLSQLEAQNRRLEHHRHQSKHVMNQFKKQQVNSTKLYDNINQSMSRVLKEGSYMVSRLEEEKRKHDCLAQLVKYYEKLIMNRKFQKYQLTKKKQNEQVDRHLKKQQDLEKQLEYLAIRTNASSYQLSRKNDQVRTLRSERAIFSSVFNQIEKQMFELELDFKKVMIKKISLEKQTEQIEKQLIKVSIQTEKQFKKFLKKLKIKPADDRENQQDNDGQNNADNLMKITNKYKTHRTKKNILESVEQFKTSRDLKGYKKQKKTKVQVPHKRVSQKKMEEEIWEKKAKQIFSDLEVKKNSQIPNDIIIFQQIEVLRKEAEDLFKIIEEKQERWKQLKNQKSIKMFTCGKRRRKTLYNEIRNSLEQTSKENINIRQQIRMFQERLYQLPFQINFQDYGMDSLEDGMIKLDEEICKIFPNVLGYESQRLCSDEARLNQILNKNRTTKNITKIYTQEEFIQISKYNLSRKQQSQKRNQ